ncbi:MAG TPA: hypothetical protein VFE50_10005 [Cyclobacteriaceae bacterium]|nr:hypothetical protein [Cyclobacteriaceae bacterium]
MRVIALLLFFACSAATAQVTNYKLADLDNEKSSPGTAIAVSPKNNKNMAAFAAGKVMYSNDGGVTWAQSTFSFGETGGAMPAITADSKGNFHMAYSTSAFTDIFSTTSADGGKTWSVPFSVSAPSTRQQYNPSLTAHPKKEEVIITWTQSDQYGANAEDCKSDIMLVMGSGKKWSKPIQVNQASGNCLDEDHTLRGSLPIIGHDMKTFILWSGQGAMFYDRSYDGEMWISTDLAIVEQVGGWNIDVDGFGRIANNSVFTIDNSASRIRGTLFMVYSDHKSGEKDGDVWLMRSVNRGDNWTVAARINQDEPGHEQFLPRICIDPASGFVYILYYDRRNYEDNQTDVYLAWSTDGGNQFKEKKINDKPFTPAIDSKTAVANYLGISAQKGLIIPVWTAINGTKQEVWTSVIKEYELNPAQPAPAKK